MERFHLMPWDIDRLTDGEVTVLLDALAPRTSQET